MIRNDATTEFHNGLIKAAPQNTFARLVAIHGTTLGLSFLIKHNSVMIGRSAASDFRIDDVSVSRQHCKIWQEKGQFHLVDLGSTNQTQCNGQFIEHIILNDQDRISIGLIEFKFLAPGNTEAHYHLAQFELAHIDHLTQLPNRLLFREALERAITHLLANEHSSDLMLAFIDLDRFKTVNEKAGHLGGDQVLKMVAEKVRQSLGNRLVGGRLGGEEFVVMLPNLTIDEAYDFAENLRSSIEQMQDGLPSSIKSVTTSIGLAKWNSLTMSSGSDLMRAADLQLLKAKAKGRNCVAHNMLVEL